nr:transposase [Amphibacillus jilinensis]
MRIHMKRSKRSLWKSPYKLSGKGREKVEKLLQMDPRLKEAYELKNKLDEWFKTSDEKTARKGMAACLEWKRASNINAFHRVRKTFIRWKQAILQSFMYPFNNGYIEGINNTIKVLKRDSWHQKFSTFET